jgi:hypothetical protein
MALLIRLLVGLTLWAGGFMLLYGLHGYGCAAGWNQRSAGPLTHLGLVLVGSWAGLLALAGLFTLALHRYPHRGNQMLSRLAFISAWSGIAGLLFMGAPVVLAARCW